MDECQSRKQLMFLNQHRGSMHRRVQSLHHWEAQTDRDPSFLQSWVKGPSDQTFIPSEAVGCVSSRHRREKKVKGTLSKLRMW